MQRSFWQTVLNPDFDRYTDETDRKKILLTHQLSIVAFSATAIFSIYSFFIHQPTLGYVNFAFTPLYAFGTWLNWKGHHQVARTFLIVLACLAVFFFSSMQGRLSGNNLLYLPIICGIFVLFDWRAQRQIVLHAILPLGCLIVLELTDYSLFSSFLNVPEGSPFFINFAVSVVTFWLCIHSLSKTNYENEVTLRESETNLLSVIENTTDSIWSVDRAECLLTTNSTFRKHFQMLTGTELKKGMRIMDFLPLEEQVIWSEIYTRALSGERFVKEVHYEFAGLPIDVGVAVNPIVNAQGEITGISFFSKDVTERKRAEENLKFQAEILSGVNDAVVGLNNNFQITYWNEGAERLYGWKAEEVFGKLLTEAYQFQWLKDTDQADALASLEKTGRCWAEMIHVPRHGEPIYVDITTQIWQDTSRNNKGHLSIIRDVSQRKKAEEESQHKSNLLQMLLDNMPVVFFRIAHDGTILESLGAGLKTLDRRQNETVDQNFYALYPQFTPEIMANASQKAVSFESTGITNGQVWYFDNYIFADKENGYIGFARDITEKKRDEEIIRHNNAKLTAILESTQNSVFAFDTHYCYTAFNSRHQESVKKMYDVTVALGMSMMDLKSQILPQDHENILECVRRAMRGEQFSVIQEYGVLYRAFFEISFTPIRNEANTIVGVAVFSQDITDRKKAEDELRRINFELDSFVYRSSHDLRAPLRSLLGLVSLVRIEQDSQQRSLYLDLIEKSVNKLDTFITDMTNFSRNSRQELNVQLVNFDSIIKDCAENLQYMTHANRVSLQTNISVQAPFYSDVVRIGTVLQNLLSNSVKYQRLHIDDAYVQIDIQADEQRAVITFADNGKGIDPAYLDRIFDMFFRASADSYGSGLGLYIVKQVVEKLQGEIKVNSRLGEGTWFTVTLPNMEHQQALSEPVEAKAEE